MDFTYEGYIKCLEHLKKSGYCTARFCDNPEPPAAVIRHDVDLSPAAAYKMAVFEIGRGYQSTYFIMVSSAFYNVFDKDNEKYIRSIAGMGHEIGLHFDVTKYGVFLSEDELADSIFKEMELLSRASNREIKSISWHIPQKEFLGKELGFLKSRGIRNAYDSEYFHGYKYCSDSMMRWRDCISDYINAEQYPKIQMLTHPVWYSEKQGLSDVQILEKELNKKNAGLMDYLEVIRPGFEKMLQSRQEGSTGLGEEI